MSLLARHLTLKYRFSPDAPSILPLVLLISNNNQTVSVAMGILQGQNMSDPITIPAASLLGIAPTVIFFLVFQRTLTRGIVAGAVK